MWGDISLWFLFALPWWLVMLSVFSCTCCPFVCLLSKNIYSGFLPIFKLEYLFVCLLLLSCMHSLYILNIKPLSDIWLASIFSHSVGWLLILLVISFATQKFWFDVVPLLFVCLLLWIVLLVLSKIWLPRQEIFPYVFF